MKRILCTHILANVPPDESYVCKKHLVEAKRHHNDDTFIPKWKRDNEDDKGCVHPQCQDRFNEKPAFATISALKTHLGVLVADDIPFLLCPPKVYHQFNPPNSSSCGLHQSMDKNLFITVPIRH